MKANPARPPKSNPITAAVLAVLVSAGSARADNPVIVKDYTFNTGPEPDFTPGQYRDHDHAITYLDGKVRLEGYALLDQEFTPTVPDANIMLEVVVSYHELLTNGRIFGFCSSSGGYGFVLGTDGLVRGYSDNYGGFGPGVATTPDTPILLAYVRETTAGVALDRLYVNGVLSHEVAGLGSFGDLNRIRLGCKAADDPGNPAPHTIDIDQYRVSSFTGTFDPAWLLTAATPRPLLANFSADQTYARAPLTVTFTDTSNPGPSGPITSRHWSFGDGVEIDTALATVSHSYTSAGTFSVALTVGDGSNTNTNTQTGLINVLGLATTYQEAVQADSPLAYWQMNETSGTAATDSMLLQDGTYDPGVLLGQPGAFPSLGLCATFTWKDYGLRKDELTIPNNTGLQVADGDFTLELWYMQTDNTEGDRNVVMRASNFEIFTVNDGSYDGAGFMFFNGHVMARPALNVWHHLVFTRASDGSGKLYLDGNTTPVASFTEGTYLLQYGNNTKFGGTAAPDDSGYTFGGSIDEIAVYAAVLPPSRIALHYAAASIAPPGGEAPAITVLERAHNGTQAFGSVAPGQSSSVHTFTIKNNGTGGTLAGLEVSKAGADAGKFTVDTTGMLTSLAVNAQTTFTVVFAPGTSQGNFTAAVRIASNVAPNPYVINLTGTGLSLYDGWASTHGLTGSTGSSTDPAFAADPNQDGVANGLVWLIGGTAANPLANNCALVPTATHAAGKLVLTFKCLKSGARGTAALNVQSSNDLGQADLWSNHQAAVPDSTPAAPVNGVTFTVSPTDPVSDYNEVTAEIPAGGGKLFGRLMATE